MEGERGGGERERERERTLCHIISINYLCCQADPLQPILTGI